MSKKSVFKNRNGNMSDEDWIRLVVDEKGLDLWMRKFRTNIHQCPPRDLVEDGGCFRCVECQRGAASAVKTYKNHYSIQNIKYPKEDIHGEK